MKTRNVMKIAGILLTLIMIVSLLGVFALTASAATGVVSYVDADGMDLVCLPFYQKVEMPLKI